MELKGKFNKLARRGGDCVIRSEAEWKSSGLEARYGDLPKGKMALCVFGGEVQENTEIIRITDVKEEGKKLVVNVMTGLLGGPPSRPGHFSHPHDVKFVPLSGRKVKFNYGGVVTPGRKKTPRPKPNRAPKN